MRRLSWLAPILLSAVLVMGQSPFRNGPPEEDEALRGRVNGFYSNFQQAKFRQAETFVAEDSRDVFYGAPKSRIFSYEIKSVEFNAEIDEATVLVAAETMLPTPLSAQPVKQPLQSRWKKIGGEWYLYLKSLEAGDSYQTPLGQMHFNTASGSDGSRPTNFKPPNLASMQTMYEVSERNLQFPAESHEPVTRTITFKNKFQSDLTIERETRDFPGMDVQIASETVPKDGETSITFVYHPEAAQLKGARHFDFVVMPITQQVRIVMQFR